MRDAAAVLLLLCLLVPRALAQPSPEKAEQEYRRRPTIELLYKMGQARRAQGQKVEAADLFRRYLEEAGPFAGPGVRQEVERFLGGDLGAGVEVAVFGDAGALVLLDDRVVGVLPLSRPLLCTPAAHKVRLEQGRRRVETSVRLQQGRPVAIRFTLVPPVAVTSPTQAALLLVDDAAVPEPLRQRLVQVASQAAAQERVLTIPREKLAAHLSATPQVAGCLGTAPCQEQVAAHFDARYVLLVRGEGPDGGQGKWHFDVRLHDVVVGAIGAEAQDGCDGCAVQRAVEVLAQLVQKTLVDGTTRPTGKLEVTSQPPGAEVKVDGRVFGPTPLLKAAFAGPHEVLLTLRDHQDYRAQAGVTDGESTRLQATLQRTLPPPAPRVTLVPVPVAPTPVPVYRRWWFWGAIGVVAAGVVVAAVVPVTVHQGAGTNFPNPRILDF